VAAPRRIADAAAALTASLTAAQLLIGEPDQQTPAMISAGGTPDSRPPWNPQAANAILDAWAGIRALEAGLRRRVTGTWLPRGGSDANTGAALDAIVGLAEAVDPHEPRDPADRGPCPCPQCRILRLLGRWETAAQALPAIDGVIRWQPVRAGPRPSCPTCAGRPCADHARPAACPYCSTFSLRAAPDRYLVACFNADCADEEGRPPLARLDVSRVTGEPMLVWSDGRVQYAA